MRPVAILGLVALLSGCQRPSPGALSVAVSETSPPVAQTPVSLPEPPASVEPEMPAAFAGDAGSKLRDRILLPSEPPRWAIDRRTRPLARDAIAALERPEAPTAPLLTTFIRFTPPPLRDAAPLVDLMADPAVPQRPELPATFLVSTPSRDVNLPAELPPLAKFQLDRASLDDPTEEFSLRAAQQTAAPIRDKPAPFVKVNLPEPFERRVMGIEVTAEPSVVAPPPRAPK